MQCPVQPLLLLPRGLSVRRAQGEVGFADVVSNPQSHAGEHCSTRTSKVRRAEQPALGWHHLGPASGMLPKSEHANGAERTASLGHRALRGLLHAPTSPGRSMGKWTHPWLSGPLRAAHTEKGVSSFHRSPWATVPCSSQLWIQGHCSPAEGPGPR